MTTRTLLRGVLAFVLAGYGAFLVGCLLLRWFVGERQVVALLNNNLHLLLFPALCLLPLCLLLRLRHVALLYALPVGFFTWNFAPFFFSAAHASKPAAGYPTNQHPDVQPPGRGSAARPDGRGHP